MSDNSLSSTPCDILTHRRGYVNLRPCKTHESRPAHREAVVTATKQKLVDGCQVGSHLVLHSQGNHR